MSCDSQPGPSGIEIPGLAIAPHQRGVDRSSCLLLAATLLLDGCNSSAGSQHARERGKTHKVERSESSAMSSTYKYEPGPDARIYPEPPYNPDIVWAPFTRKYTNVRTGDWMVVKNVDSRELDKYFYTIWTKDKEFVAVLSVLRGESSYYGKAVPYLRVVRAQKRDMRTDIDQSTENIDRIMNIFANLLKGNPSNRRGYDKYIVIYDPSRPGERT